MKNFTADFRSDTVTKPCAGMREAMFTANVGDDVYGEDPTVNLLEEKVAKLVGKEAALFVPSGTMANQIAINLHTRPGDCVVAEQDSHVYLYEVGASSALSGVQFDLIPYEKNFSNASIDEYFKPKSPYTAWSTLLVVENTHNRGAGKVIDASHVNRIIAHGKKLGMAVHLDGARIWNACIALNEDIKNFTTGFDSVSVCFSKGLGAPVGSALCGSKDFIDGARRVRKRWGGGMRQAGILAAAAIYGIDHNWEKLTDDHRRMKTFIEKVRGLEKSGHHIKVDAPELNTNIMYFNVPPEKGEALHQKLWKNGVLTNLLGPGRIRALTHLQISDQDIDQATEIIRNSLRELGL